MSCVQHCDEVCATPVEARILGVKVVWSIVEGCNFRSNPCRITECVDVFCFLGATGGRRFKKTSNGMEHTATYYLDGITVRVTSTSGCEAAAICIAAPLPRLRFPSALLPVPNHLLVSCPHAHSNALPASICLSVGVTQ